MTDPMDKATPEDGVEAEWVEAMGVSSHRLDREPLEQIFHRLWSERCRRGLLRFLLDRSHSNRGDYQPTPEEEEVAATVIQWLGSPVGQGFLFDVKTKARKEGLV